MSRKIIVITGSPRKKGNTNTVVGWFKEAAEALGASVEIVDAARLEYKVNGCTACMKCQMSEEYECVIEDEASPVIARIPDYDVVVFATPIYWFGPSAQLKLLLDRTFALVKEDDPAAGEISTPYRGKTMVLIATAGGGLGDGLSLTETAFQTACGFIGCEFESVLVPNAPVDPSEMVQRADAKEQAEALAQRILV